MLMALLTSIAMMPTMLSQPVLMPTAQAASYDVTRSQATRKTVRVIDQGLIDRAEAAMRSLTAVKGRFAQTDWDGTRALGRFALQKPGKLRFDYSDDSLTVISDGVTLAVTDKELETTDSVPLGATPLGSILSGRRQFQETTTILETHQAGEHFFVTLEDKGDEWPGKLTLKFHNTRNDLAGWVTTDETGATTQVDLYEVETDPKLNPRLFIIVD